MNAAQLKQDFPILSRQVNGKPLAYLDNGATSQKPQSVIDAITHYYQTSNANVHRGVHTLSDESTQAWEKSRQTIAQFFGAEPAELILTRNTTEALNGVVYGWALDHLQIDDVVLTTVLEHHANIVPWQQICKRLGAKLEFIAIDADGRVDENNFDELLTQHGDKIKLIVLTQVSNALGTHVPIQKFITKISQKYSAENRPRIVIDGAQAAPHLPIEFHKMGVDFFAFSGHKMLGPMGVGGLLVRKKLLETNEMKPWLFGGGMIESVTQAETIFNQDAGERFTPGTPDVASAVGLAAACEYLQNLGMKNVQEHDQQLVAYTIEKLSQIPEVQLIGPLTPRVLGTTPDVVTTAVLDRVGSVSFVYKDVHAHDVAQVLDSEGVAVRSGHHCTMPLHLEMGWQASVRVSFQVYNTTEDIDQLITALAKVQQVFST